MLNRTIRDLIGDQRLLKMHGEDTIVEAANAMAERGVAAVLVSEGTETYGIVTDHDIVDRVVAEGLSPADTLLIHVMTPDPIAVGIDDTALDALLMMRDLMRALVGELLTEHGIGDEMWQGLHS